MAIHLTSVRIKNFRGIRDLTVKFDETTVFIGENSVGKTSILEAVRLALSRRWGQRGTGFAEYDFYTDHKAPDPKRGEGISIDLDFVEPEPGKWPEEFKNLTIKAGNTPHRRYLPHLVDLVATGAIDPTQVLTQSEPLEDAIEAYKAFDRRESGWVKVELRPEAEARKAA